ncbi:MAG: Gfo/Idh/MocA family oxidoreductase [Candidatus Omnitrophota bacterium]|nr:Gfo/Idh/MocA family oxidoreductase [Candidatus Omnitrophota bacterium]
MRRKINIGIIGYGQWGPNFARVLGSLDDVLVAGICDADKNKRALIKRTWPGVAVLSSYRGLLNDPAVDAVVVVTPVSTHYAIAKDALEAGKHVLVEKPLSANSAQAQDLVSLSLRMGKLLMVGHTFLYNPAVRKVKEILISKALGKIYYIHSRRTNLGPLRQDVNVIWDLSPHDISIINYLLDDLPLEAAAVGWNFLAHDLNDVGLISLKYARGIPAHIHVSWLDPKKIREMTIVGSKKMLVYNDIDTREPIKIYDKKVMKKKYDLPYKSFREFQLIVRDGSVATPKVELEEPLKMECMHFVDCIKNGKGPLSDGAQGRDVVRILESIDKSISSGGIKIKINA